MLPNHPNQLLQNSLDKLSQELHNKMDSHLLKMQQEQQTLINNTLSQLIPTLLTKLTPIIKQEVERQNQPMLEQVKACLNALTSTNQQQLKMLNLGREEYQSLQDRMAALLTELDQLSLLDDNGVKNSLNSLQTSITSLQTQVTNLQNSQTSMTNEQTALSVLIDELETLKGDMDSTLTSLKQQQTSLEGSLVQFQPLLPP